MIGLPQSDVSIVTSLIIKGLVLLVLIGIIFASSTGGLIVWIVAGLIVLTILWIIGVRTVGKLGGR